MSLEQKRELAKEASALLDPNSLFSSIITVLTKECIAELLACPIGDLTATAAHARMKGLDDIKARLRIIQNDAMVAENRAKRDD